MHVYTIYKRVKYNAIERLIAQTLDYSTVHHG